MSARRRPSEPKTRKKPPAAGSSDVVAEFERLAAALTGTPVKDLSKTDHAALRAILARPTRRIDCSQLNELLLLVNKDRVTSAFFDYFFSGGCALADLPARVVKFQTVAMRRYGNFIYAFRRLSRMETAEDLREELADVGRAPNELRRAFAQRARPLIDIDPIAKEETYLLGYISARAVAADVERARFLQTQFASVPDGTAWDRVVEQVVQAAGSEEQSATRRILETIGAGPSGASVAEARSFVDESVKTLDALADRTKQVQDKARLNQDVYLTWDHMDVYFATSMRTRWEFEELHDFVAQLMRRREFRNVRYFDPTQAFMESRIDKGLIESLMLKRARCTVYQVQDTDTLGKDSELAATLAQGKPVIAFVPRVSETQRTNALVAGPLSAISDRVRFIRFQVESFDASLTEADHDAIRRIDDEARKHVWKSTTESRSRASRDRRAPLRPLCKKLASAEQRFYDGRARTLTEIHPLALQVNLQSGVANGVLVVRTVEDCAELLRRILVNDMEFDLEESKDMWTLREVVSSSVFRAVSKNRKLTNCFWNFYREAPRSN